MRRETSGSLASHLPPPTHYLSGVGDAASDVTPVRDHGDKRTV
jgi:hypothetical protein